MAVYSGRLQGSRPRGHAWTGLQTLTAEPHFQGMEIIRILGQLKTSKAQQLPETSSFLQLLMGDANMLNRSVVQRCSNFAFSDSGLQIS